ncbi:uncharacterized protein LOC124359560 isoform X2 [Homalodisca vitripennis]|uniref:uncharacterized protein LOC124359560 isoform X2 n=1 Tax=Homalodisca vitripennis TaxID=197043 RepID=UPI001EEB7D54|nr:uncharacterized protein LOC124359560 isoform X2 [Homalodisca vitripennis]
MKKVTHDFSVWMFHKIKPIMMDFTIKRADFPEDMKKIDDFIYEKFLPDMPLIRLFNIDTSSPRHMLPSPHQPSPDSGDIYLKAVDVHGKIIGLAINKETVHFNNDADATPEWQRMADFMDFVEKHAQLHQMTGRTIELFVLSVSSDWRQRGVARRLVEESMALARDAGFQTMTIFCTGEFVARIPRSLGWREHYRLAYQDYPTLSGRDVPLIAVPPHDHAYYFAIKL